MEVIGRAIAIDIFLLVLFLRINYIAPSKGFAIEIFKIIGLTCGSIFAFQYYPILTERLTEKDLFSNIPRLVTSLSFLLIVLGSVVLFSLLRKIFTAFFAKKEIATTEKLFALFFGWFRFVLLSSIIIFFLYLSPFNSEHLKESRFSRLFKPIAPKIYLTSFKLYNKVNPELTLNEEVEEYYEVKEFLSADSEEGD